MNHYGPLFRVLHWCTSGLLNEAFSQYGLTASQGRVLGVIAHRTPAPCAKDLEDFFKLSHPSISGVLKRLEQKGFIELRCDPDDHRCNRIYLSSKGIECNEGIRHQIESIESTVVHGFTPEEQEQFLRFLNRSITNMDGYHLDTNEEVKQK